MRNRWLIYLLVGLCFGIADWYFLDLWASLSKSQALDDTLLQAPEYIRQLFVIVIVVSNYGVWLIPVIPIAIYEVKRSHSLRRAALSAILVWSMSLLSYYSYYAFMLMFIGLPNMEFMLFSNRQSATYWAEWWSPFKRIILEQFVEWIGIAFFGGAIVGTLSAHFSLVLQRIVQKRRSILVIKQFMKRRPTQRASDLGYAPRFLSVFLARGWFRQSGVISSHPKRVTHTVGRQNVRRHERLCLMLRFLYSFMTKGATAHA